MNVLLIEPDVALARFYQEILSAQGYNVAVSRGAQSAVHIADGQPPDLVIMELQLASHNGVEFLYEFRSYAEWASVPVIILSRIPPHEMHSPVLWQQLAVAAYLYKPQTSLTQLITVVSDVLSYSKV